MSKEILFGHTTSW